MYQYFGTPVGPQYKKKFARNFGIAVLILFAFYGIWSLAVQLNPDEQMDLAPKETADTSVNPNVPKVTVPYNNDYLPYTENYNVPFDYEGRIDYDSLIKQLMPEIFQEQLRKQGVQVERQTIELLHGQQFAMYQESSSVCGYVIDDDKTIYWLEGFLNKTHIEHQIHQQNPMPCKVNQGSCWCTADTLAAEQLIENKTYLTKLQEQTVADLIIQDQKDNPNMNRYQFTVGYYNYDYGVEGIIPFCGELIGKSRNPYFEGVIDQSQNLEDFSLEKNLSPLCAINQNATVYDISGK